MGPKGYRKNLAERFWAKVNKSGKCWLWTAATDSDGYGWFWYEGKTIKATAMSLMLDGRQLAEGHHALHTCRTPACIRPDHLYGGTEKQNAADRDRDGTTCSGGRHHRAKLTVAQVVAIRESAASGTRKVRLAEQYGVSSVMIGYIVAGKSWRAYGKVGQ